MQSLIEWATKEGALNAGFVARERTVIATENIAAGSCIFSIPQHLLLHEGRAWSDPHYGTAFTRLKEAVGDALDRRWALCLLLLVEKARGKGSFWAAYIAALPTSYSDPLWWGQEALSLLEGTRLGAGVNHHGNNLRQLGLWRQQLCELQAVLGGPDTLQGGADGWAMTDEALRWAKSTVWSRAFNIPYLGAPGKGGIALIPFADMLDHSHDRHMAWHTGASGTDPFTFITHTPITKGSPAFSNYGYKSNEELILGYGFMLRDNPADFFHVSLGLHAQTEDDKERVMQRRALLSKLGLPTNHYLTLTRPLPSTLLAATAVCLMPDAQAYELLTSADGPNTKTSLADSAKASNGQLGSNGVKPSAEASGNGERGSECQMPGMVEVKAAPLQPEQGLCSENQAPPSTQGRRLDCSFRLRLEALKAVRQQLQRKLVDIQGGSPDADLELASKQAPGSGTYMALMYRAGQKRIALKVLAALSQEAYLLLGQMQQASRELSVSEASRPAVPDSSTSNSNVEMATAQNGSELQRGAEQTQTGSSIKVLPGCVPWDQGVVCVQDAAEEQALATETLSQGFAGCTTRHLVIDLVAARCRREHHSKSGSARSRLLERLCSEVEVPLAAKVLSRDAHTMQLVSCLQGTPAEEARQSASAQLADDFHEDRTAIIYAISSSSSVQSEHIPVSVTQAELVEALAWAQAVVDRCAVEDTRSNQAAVTHLTSAIPKEYRGTAIDITWVHDEEHGDSFLLTAAVPLDAGWCLARQALMDDASFETLLMDWGPSAAARAAKGGKAALAYEICLSPGDELVGPMSGSALLTDSAIGGTHWLTMSSGQEGALAAVALCAANGPQLAGMDADGLCRAAATANSSMTRNSGASMTSEGLQGSGKHVTEEEAAQLWRAQQKVRTALLGSKQLMSIARSQLRVLLRSAKEEMLENPDVASRHPDSHEWAASQYRASMIAIVEHHLSMLRAGKKRRTP